ncbi:MAG: 6-carboxytetrahydropterin synthase [Lutibacter sp.]|uniref:6-pyruvoyl trahydropterin synthase family protein n=1 Tax=Lutibacter sp. TaxID=1925666 RepID=UPI0017B7A646|nr:6-carboxytetrahydropterin synthase [Lutibacter sp.]MBT8317072.1 6-carboxytetrahydropterin synthase [Lutibacter sp.]NNJ57932.1 6-carboxytetrahydropterin synthase [Lutibacter sp.]
MKVTVSRKSHFNAAHRLYNADWSDARNATVFGKCSNPNYHGHNYELIVSVKGEIHPETGFVMDMKILKDLISIEIEEKFDHKNLNEEVEVFKTLNPTAENIVVVIWNQLRTKIDESLELSVTLYETPRNFVSYSGE